MAYMPGINTTSLRIRSHRTTDLPRLHAIDQICFDSDIAFTRAEISFYLNHRNSISRVAEMMGCIIGFAVGRIEGNSSAHVLTLDVLPEARRSGIGTSLMNSLHEEFERREAVLIFLEVKSSDGGARKFYEALRYEYVETLRGYYNGREDAMRMIRMI
jgi:[ribosomal protein S18]-alanine N-acetyltransferase